MVNAPNVYISGNDERSGFGHYGGSRRGRPGRHAGSWLPLLRRGLALDADPQSRSGTVGRDLPLRDAGRLFSPTAGLRTRGPLSAALGPPVEYAHPPWIRVFQLTSGYPWWLPWRHVARSCPGCRQRVTFAVWTRPRRDRCAYSTLCLACGRATSEYVSSANRGMSEAPLSGSEWSPPCVAVARLRRAVFAYPTEA